MSINSPMGLPQFSGSNFFGQSPSAGSAPTSFGNSPYFNSNIAMGGNGMGNPMLSKPGMGMSGMGMPFWARALGLNPSQFMPPQLQNPTPYGPPLSSSPTGAPGYTAQFPNGNPYFPQTSTTGSPAAQTPNFLPQPAPPATSAGSVTPAAAPAAPATPPPVPMLNGYQLGNTSPYVNLNGANAIWNSGGGGA